ncbi:hypothetical protein SEA_ESTES_65 [Mycobacterium phage Estes]|uniref:Uncharacterized protein n=2 Tax=Reyvirus TaxID=1623301 RepID=A0A7G9A2D5_9CAUD|nr:hypothetical protein J4U03_gp065 [Mycobacterium phage Estes]YP_010013972.1 hypothetical protein J4U04_gp066 [Mycobacterium phage MrMagoo]APQ42170.1 hypothetical protein PBI_MRMAGOO_66 [Mycobacterium phage MrMagoo]ARM70245.1 hypothetical protein SEA_GARDENSALSA_65 [Mycobacterium phage GardenSalsa]QNL30774.1 hypothetical protein SEA_ESTES_65 [Mycobacterium phage Estes]
MSDKTIEQQLTDILEADEADDVYCLRRESDIEVGGFKHADYEVGENRRWARGDTIIVQHTASGRYFAFDFDEGLTEYQEDEVYADSVREVKRVVKTVEIVTWPKVK